ncbi:hypothetical protein B0T10DRAFT_572778 [Thelonectria olida]|uniref:Uncharacterized protein n=1 Tax=Thelonectria olida TaxID=1576542 RepID=A0A9P9APV3_9HYPO|nr:hypothetical protein B0T10DRAFT_572778 [Thelonectria olida]
MAAQLDVPKAVDAVVEQGRDAQSAGHGAKNFGHAGRVSDHLSAVRSQRRATLTSGANAQSDPEQPRQGDEQPRYAAGIMNSIGHAAVEGNSELQVGNTYINNYSEPNRNRCIADLRLTDPRDDKTRIEQTKGGLLKDSYCWILDNDDFQQ